MGSREAEIGAGRTCQSDVDVARNRMVPSAKGVTMGWEELEWTMSLKGRLGQGYRISVLSSLGASRS
jgi:hypothetical protein